MIVLSYCNVDDDSVLLLMSFHVFTFMMNFVLQSCTRCALWQWRSVRFGCYGVINRMTKTKRKVTLHVAYGLRLVHDITSFLKAVGDSNAYVRGIVARRTWPSALWCRRAEVN